MEKLFRHNLTIIFENKNGTNLFFFCCIMSQQQTRIEFSNVQEEITDNIYELDIVNIVIAGKKKNKKKRDV